MLTTQIRRQLGRLLQLSDHTAPTAARLFLRQSCGLCEEALAVVRPFAQRGRLALELVDIAADPDLFRRYCFSIPVLEIEDGPVLEWPFDGAALRRALG